MVSKNQGNYMEFVFTRETRVSQREKIKAFWKFIEAQDKLKPHKGRFEIDSLESESQVSSTRTSEEKHFWEKGLEIFQQLDLDKIALASDRKCKLCLMERMIRCEDLADTVTQPYDELKADMITFEQRKRDENSAASETFGVGNR